MCLQGWYLFESKNLNLEFHVKRRRIMNTYRILAVCGAGLATSTHVAKALQSGLEKRGVNSQIRTCSVVEAPGIILSYKPDVILATVSVNSIKDSGNIKIFSGIPLLTGVGTPKLLDDVVAYLKNKE
jgi:Phosphotransferase system, galactitol-specific IIB component